MPENKLFQILFLNYLVNHFCAKATACTVLLFTAHFTNTSTLKIFKIFVFVYSISTQKFSIDCFAVLCKLFTPN